VIPSEGGKPIRFTTGSGSKIRPSWSHDGKWIYYCVSGDTGPQIWKKAANGGAEIRITKNGGCNQMESPDGRYLLLPEQKQQRLWRVPVNGGEEIQLAELGPEAQFALGKHDRLLRRVHVREYVEVPGLRDSLNQSDWQTIFADDSWPRRFARRTLVAICKK
jgi:WD40-like Beta Propeller Repeat